MAPVPSPGGRRVSGWMVRDTECAYMYICLCVSVYVNMYLRVYSIAILAPKINLMSIMGDYKSSK